MKDNEKSMALHSDNNSKIRFGFRQDLAMALPYAGKKSLAEARKT